MTDPRCALTDWVRRGVVVGLSAGLFLSAAAADTVVLTDGSRLQGQLLRLEDGVFTLETGFAGALKIKAELIQELRTDEPMVVGLATGDRLVGPVEWPEGAESPAIVTEMGAVPINFGGVAAIWSPADKSPEQLQAEADAEAFRAELESKLAAAQPDWSFTAEFGATKKDGNTESFDFRGALDLQRKTAKDNLRFFVTGEYGEENDARDTSEVIGGIEYEYLFSERFFAYGRNTYEYDEFEQLELRIDIAGGVGYYFIKEEPHELKGRVGAGLRHETFLQNEDGTKPDSNTEPFLDIGADYRLDIQEWLRFKYGITYTPSFEGLDDYRIVSDASFLIPIAKSEAWGLKFGVEHEYDSKPASDVKRLDTTYYTNVVFNLD